MSYVDDLVVDGVTVMKIVIVTMAVDECVLVDGRVEEGAAP